VTPAPPPELVIIGDCNPDVLVLGGDVAPEYGQREQLVPAISLVIGGSAAITAVAAARLGVRTSLVAAVGDDPAGQFMRGELTRAGVDVSSVIVRPGLATGITVALTRGTDRAILTATGAMTALTAEDVPASLLAAARHVHVSSYFLMADSLGPGLADVLRRSRAAGASTSLDTNWDPAEKWLDEQLRAVLDECDVLLPNEAEALCLSGAASPELAAAKLSSAGARIAIKMGARGAMALSGEHHYFAAPPPAQVVDSTGAGDCFNAGLLAGLLRGLDMRGALALGCAAGTASTRALGGTGGSADWAEATALAAAVRVWET